MLIMLSSLLAATMTSRPSIKPTSFTSVGRFSLTKSSYRTFQKIDPSAGPCRTPSWIGLLPLLTRIKLACFQNVGKCYLATRVYSTQIFWVDLRQKLDAFWSWSFVALRLGAAVFSSSVVNLLRDSFLFGNKCFATFFAVAMDIWGLGGHPLGY